MNDRDPRPRLLADTYGGDWETGPAGRLAARAAASVRRRRLVRRALGATAAAAVLAFLALPRAPAPPSAPDPLLRAETPPAYEILTDDQLLAEVRDRPLGAMPDAGGKRRIVLLGD